MQDEILSDWLWWTVSPRVHYRSNCVQILNRNFHWNPRIWLVDQTFGGFTGATKILFVWLAVVKLLWRGCDSQGTALQSCVYIKYSTAQLVQAVQCNELGETFVWVMAHHPCRLCFAELHCCHNDNVSASVIWICMWSVECFCSFVHALGYLFRQRYA